MAREATKSSRVQHREGGSNGEAAEEPVNEAAAESPNGGTAPFTDPDPVAHLDPATALRLVDGSTPPDEAASAQIHLQQCADCRQALRAHLEHRGFAMSHPAWELVESAQEWADMAAAGEAATRAARTELHAKGIHPVFQQAGALVEELPDGSTRPLLTGSRPRA